MNPIALDTETIRVAASLSDLENPYESALNDTLAWSRRRNYCGYTKHDALLSPLLSAIFGWSKWPRIIAIQTVMRAPINVRPFLGVPPSCNPKGFALFAQAYLDRYAVRRTVADLAEARILLERLLDLRPPNKNGTSCWGYPYPWQDLGFYAPAGTPNAVVSAFVCESFLDAYEQTGEQRYMDVTRSALSFFLTELKVLRDEPEELCLSYMPVPMRMRVLDVSILIGAMLARYGKLSGDLTHVATASRLVNYVVRRQTDYAAWFYTDPPNDSPITHDNYHTGFILDALWRYMNATGDRHYEDVYWRGLRFYREHLFNVDGSPRWMNNRDYPHDIHGAAQGIITFSRHPFEYPEFAQTVADWALRRMYDSDGRFYYQEARWFRKRFTLMRWCQAWMARALACLIRARSIGHESDRAS